MDDHIYEFCSQVERLLALLLRWNYLNGNRSKTAESQIERQRRRVLWRLETDLTLKRCLNPARRADIWNGALVAAADWVDITAEGDDWRWPVEDVLRVGFLPDDYWPGRKLTQ